jgi:hypothetical protein
MLAALWNSSISESLRSDPGNKDWRVEKPSKVLTKPSHEINNDVDRLDLFFAFQYLMKLKGTRFPPKT